MSYLRTDKLIIPRQVFALTDPSVPPKIPPQAGLQWVGWFAVAANENPDYDKTYAVWQDYKHRGFEVVGPDGQITRLHTLAGDDLEGLITAIVKLAKRKD